MLKTSTPQVPVALSGNVTRSFRFRQPNAHFAKRNNSGTHSEMLFRSVDNKGHSHGSIFAKVTRYAFWLGGLEVIATGWVGELTNTVVSDLQLTREHATETSSDG